MSNSQFNSKEVYESNSDARVPYLAPQVFEISLVEGRVTLGICKTGSTGKSGSGTGNCRDLGGTACNSLATGS